MKLAALHLRQRDGVTCGPAVAVVAGALLDPRRQGELADPAWFADEQARVHAELNRIWPRRLGTTPTGMARALTTYRASSGVRYRWRLFRGRRDRLSDVRRAVTADLPVAMLIGRFVPRHWVLIVDVDWLQWQCYEPSSGEWGSAEVGAVRRPRLQGFGFSRAFALLAPWGFALLSAPLLPCAPEVF